MGTGSLTMFDEIFFGVLNGRPSVNRHMQKTGKILKNYTVFPGAKTHDLVFEVRNEMFRFFLEETNLNWLVMMDDDVVLTKESIPFLLSTADVTGPRVVGEYRGREVHNHTVSAAALKLSRKAVEKLGMFWQKPTRGRCDCTVFYNRCVSVGLKPLRAGTVGHRIPVTVFPGPIFVLDSDIKYLGEKEVEPFTEEAKEFETVNQEFRIPSHALPICIECDGENCPNVVCGDLAILYPCPRNSWQVEELPR